MTEKLDYSREDAMAILNSENYTDEDKKQIYDKYMSDLKKRRRKEIINRLNNYAMDNEIITEEIYVAKLKEYENDDLSKPFEVIEKELSDFATEMKQKYDEYISKKNQEEINIVPDIKAQPLEKETFDDTIFSNPVELSQETEPSLILDDEVSVLNEEPEILAKPLFPQSDEDEELLPEDEKDDEKGNASAIIVSIIAVIIGIVVMYSIIRLN